ncbi:MAG: anthranilate synthase component I family protein [archaeon]
MAKLQQRDPLHCIAALRTEYKNCFLLESATPGKFRLNRYSFLGFDPELLIEIKNGVARVNGKEQNIENPFEFLKEISNANRCESKLPYAGGLVGYVGYDAIRYIEEIPDNCKDDLNLPDMKFGLYKEGVVIDRFANCAYYFSFGKYRAEEVEKVLGKEVLVENGAKVGSIKSNSTKEQFEQNVGIAKERLRQGEIFQVVLSQRFDVESELDPLVFYARLRSINPSNYMFYLDFDTKIVGASPESLVRVSENKIETNPIAGTRPRGKTEEEDAKLAKELLADPKENAEHIMLVDLGRNDIGKVAKFGTVEVPEYKNVEKYSHVQHIVSRVTGELRKGKDVFDGFKATFPAGTLTGAPKVRAMEIIDELENTKRGPYGGCVGYFSANGNMDFAIAIRTAIIQDNVYRIQAGAGIVMDSDPEQEHEECRHKADALVEALQ